MAVLGLLTLGSHHIVCSDIPGELQKALHLYLGSRGISTHFTDFVHAYMITKECLEYLSWLRKLKGLVKG
jgi:complement component 1 Q subcomponent-binding protein, mitochondrial